MYISINTILDNIMLFYHSTFWKLRYYRRLHELGITVSTYKEIMNSMDSLIKEIKFKTYKDETSSNGLSYSKIIELNLNIDTWEKDISHFENLIMHELGHIQYNLRECRHLRLLNNLVIKNGPYSLDWDSLFLNPLPYGLENELDIKYFSDPNEIRLRIIPIVREMWLNNWTAELAYELSCKYDDIFELYDRETIIYWINNLL